MTITKNELAAIKAVIEEHVPDGNPCDCCAQQGCNGTECIRKTDEVHWSPEHVWEQITTALGVVNTKYKIVRFYADDSPQRVIRTGLTLAQAQEHCTREDTHGEGWFDGYTEMKS